MDNSTIKGAMMTLGEKLKATFEELERAQIVGAEKQHNVDMEKIRKDRRTIKDKLDKINDLFIKQIEAGKIPWKKVEDYEWESWIKVAAGSKELASHQDLWVDFKSFWEKEGLSLSINHGHDGIGTKIWLTITLVISVKESKPNAIFNDFHLGNR
jgi:DNA primase catalytic subunit